MSDEQRDQEALRAVFQEAHRETRENTPTFAALWQRAQSEQPSRRRPRRPVFAILAAAVASLVLVAGLISTRGLIQPEAEVASGDAEISKMATSLSEWRAPLDFLLRTPGSEWLQTTPRLGSDSTSLPALPLSQELPNDA